MVVEIQIFTCCLTYIASVQLVTLYVQLNVVTFCASREGGVRISSQSQKCAALPVGDGGGLVVLTYHRKINCYSGATCCVKNILMLWFFKAIRDKPDNPT